MMMRIVLAFAFCGLCLVGPVSADETKKVEDTKPAGRRDFDKKTPLDRDFLAVASERVNCGSEMAALVEKRASRQDVKDFAKKLHEDHKTLLNDLAKVVKDSKIAIVAGTSKADRARLGEIGKLEGAEFETTYLKEVIDRHEKAIAMCDNQVKNGKDKSVSEFAKEAAKTLRDHVKQAKKLQA